MIWKAHDDQFITIGDAAASFIQRPDPVTKGLSLHSREDFSNPHPGAYGCGKTYFKARPFKKKVEKCEIAASRDRWLYVILLLVPCIDAC